MTRLWFCLLGAFGLSASIFPVALAQGVVEFAPYSCSESYPEACKDPSERERMRKARQQTSDRERARRDAEQKAQAARDAERRREISATADRLGLPAHRSHEAERFLKMKEAAGAARGAHAECRSAPKVLVESSPFLDSRSAAEAALNRTRPEVKCPDTAGGRRGPITCHQTPAFPHESAACSLNDKSSKCSGQMLWQCKMTIHCTAPQLICPPSKASKQ